MSAGGPTRLGRSAWLALAFTAAYLGVAATAAVARGNAEFVLYVGVVAVLVGVLLVVHRRVSLHPASLWCLSAWGLAHMCGGLLVVSDEFGVLYNWRIVPGGLKYDQVVHAYGFGVATWVCWQALARRAPQAPTTPGFLFLCVCAGTGLGALNEVLEFAAVLLLPETNVGGYLNTGWDLVANLVGAIAAAAWIYAAERRRRRRRGSPQVRA